MIARAGQSHQTYIQHMMSLSRIVPSKAVNGVLLATLCITGCGRASGAGPRVTPVAVSQCRIDEVSREKLLDSRGRQVYIQPIVAVSNTRGELLLAGEHNHVFGRNHVGGWTRLPEDSLLGAIVPRTGPSELVRSPVPNNLLGGVHAVARRDGTWAVIFAELKRPVNDQDTDSIAHIWYGVLDGSRWSDLERVPLPTLGTIQTAPIAAPVETNGVFSWPVLLSTTQHPADVLVLRREHGKWSHEVVPTIFASYAALAHPVGADPLLVVVQPDLDLTTDGNSLFLWARRSGWTRIAKLVASSEEAVHHPRLDYTGAVGALSWTGDRGRNGEHARTMSGTLHSFEGPIVALDSAVTPGSRQSTVEIDGLGRVWVLDHEGPNGADREIRFVMRSGDRIVRVGRIPHPFIGSFVAASPSPRDVIIAGGIQDSAAGVVATHVIRARVSCSSAPH